MRHKFIALLALLLALGGCHRTVAPTVTPTPTATPTPAPASSEESGQLWGFPIDDTHDAFEVDTKGALGTVLVTVERGEENTGEFGGYHYILSVWNKADLTTPIQTFEEIAWTFGDKALVDADFDGHTDFLCTWDLFDSINWPSSLYIWDKDQGRFVYKTTFLGRGVSVDEKTRTIRSLVHYTNASGAEEIYRWENSELVCGREVEITYPTGPDEDLIELIVRENTGGEMAEIYRDGFSEESVIWDESYKWYDPDYYESVWGFPVDDTHDAFLVPTKGKLGTVLVTVEQDEESAERYDYHCTLSVWRKDDLSTPIQTVTKKGVIMGQYRDLLDANFDGYTDFCYVIYPGAKNNDYCLYTWDEELGQFRFAANFLGHELELHEETQTLVNWSNMAASDKVREEYCWENGELVCFQMETFDFPDDDDGPQSVEHVIYEPMDGELVEVFRETY